MTTQHTVTTLGALIEGLFGRLIPVASLPALFKTIDELCYVAVHDDHLRVGRKYSQHARDTYPHPDLEKPFDGKDDEYLFLWWDAFWSWREMLTPHDFERLNGETVVLSEVAPV